VFHPQLGAFFTALRTARGWTMRQAAELAKRKGLKELTRQVLLRIEKGQTKNPEPAVLRSLAELYEQNYRSVVAMYVEEQYGLRHGDLPRHGRKEESHPSTVDGGEQSAAAQARILELEQAGSERDALISAMQDVQKRLADALAAHGSASDNEGARPNKQPATARRGHRKAG
jgi:transcriptional regulator with XRE-family HTH domain